MLPLSDLLPKLAFEHLTYLKEVAPGTHAYGMRQAMHRVRSYTTASLGPLASRGSPQEMLLVGHLHVEAGLVKRIEGFNGQEGQRWADRAQKEVEKAGLLAPGFEARPVTPLLACKDAKNPR